MNEKITAKYWVWSASLLGASATAFGLGIVLADSFSSQSAWLIIIAGVVLHGFGMYRMYKK